LINWAINDGIILHKVVALSEIYGFYLQIGNCLELIGKIFGHLNSTAVKSFEKSVWVIIVDILHWCTGNGIMMLDQCQWVKRVKTSGQCILNIFITAVHIDHSSCKEPTLCMEKGGVTLRLIFLSRSWCKESSPELVSCLHKWHEVAAISWPLNIFFLNCIQILCWGRVKECHISLLFLI